MENGNYYIIIRDIYGMYWDNGNYYVGFRAIILIRSSNMSAQSTRLAA